MLSKTPRFLKGDLVVFPKSPNILFRIEQIETKWYFFHCYFVSETSLENYDCPGCNMEPLKKFSQNQIWLASYYDVVKYYSMMMYVHFGINRKGKPWTHIEHNVLLEIFPILKRFNSIYFEKDIESIFGRSFLSIKSQYNKVSKL